MKQAEKTIPGMLSILKTIKKTLKRYEGDRLPNPIQRLMIDDLDKTITEVYGFMALAPEMLEMVKEVVQHVEGNGLHKLPREEACAEYFTCTLYYHFAKDILAKAEGGE